MYISISIIIEDNEPINFDLDYKITGNKYIAKINERTVDINEFFYELDENTKDTIIYYINADDIVSLLYNSEKLYSYMLVLI